MINSVQLSHYVLQGVLRQAHQTLTKPRSDQTGSDWTDKTWIRSDCTHKTRIASDQIESVKCMDCFKFLPTDGHDWYLWIKMVEREESTLLNYCTLFLLFPSPFCIYCYALILNNFNKWFLFSRGLGRNPSGKTKRKAVYCTKACTLKSVPNGALKAWLNHWTLHVQVPNLISTVYLGRPK